MRITIFLAVLLLANADAGIAAAQTSVSNLAKPPAAAVHFTILSTAGKHGESTRWTTPDGIQMGRDTSLSAPGVPCREHPPGLYRSIA
jgi:hypothetical protein